MWKRRTNINNKCIKWKIQQKKIISNYTPTTHNHATDTNFQALRRYSRWDHTGSRWLTKTGRPINDEPSATSKNKEEITETQQMPLDTVFRFHFCKYSSMAVRSARSRFFTCKFTHFYLRSRMWFDVLTRAHDVVIKQIIKCGALIHRLKEVERERESRRKKGNRSGEKNFDEANWSYVWNYVYLRSSEWGPESFSLFHRKYYSQKSRNEF